MVQAIGARWGIEECFETGKEMGLEDYEVRCWIAWYRYVTLVMIVGACLAGICATARRAPIESPPDEETPVICPLLSLTIPEVRHLLALLLWPPPRSATLVLAWSWWRRCHQSRASYFHRNVVVPPGKVRPSARPSRAVWRSREFSGIVPFFSCLLSSLCLRKEFFS